MLWPQSGHLGGGHWGGGQHAAQSNLDTHRAGLALILLHRQWLHGASTASCCQVFWPMGIPVGSMSWLHGFDLACGPEVEYPWSTLKYKYNE